jgi:hypothetical protein
MFMRKKKKKKRKEKVESFPREFFMLECLEVLPLPPPMKAEPVEQRAIWGRDLCTKPR